MLDLQQLTILRQQLPGLKMFTAVGKNRPKLILPRRLGHLVRIDADAAVGWKLQKTRTAVAAVDRLVHHATILEMNVESYRRHHAVQQARNKPARSSKRATAKKLSPSPFKTDS